MEKKGLTVAMLVADGFEQVELVEPTKALENAGATVHIISPQQNTVRGWKHTEWGDTFDVDVLLDDASVDDYDMLVLPGGVMNPDTLRMVPAAIDFIGAFNKAGKPIAAICHGPWPLIDAEVVKGKTMTSYPSIKLDLVNAGADWVDKEVVVDGNIITSRKPADIPAFNKEIIAFLSKE